MDKQVFKFIKKNLRALFGKIGCLFVLYRDLDKNFL